MFPLVRAAVGIAVALVLGVACDDGMNAPTPVASVTVSPGQAGVFEGEAMPLVAIVKDPSGRELKDRPVTWSSSRTDVATVSPSGMVQGLAAGTARITARSQGREGHATVNVAARVVDRVTVEPEGLVLEWNGSRTLFARAFDAAGAEITGRPVQWSSNNALVAEVNAAGVVEARGEGLTQIVARIGDKHAYASVEVAPAPVARVIVMPPVLDLEVGEDASFAVRLEDPLGRPVYRTVLWSSNDRAAAPVTEMGRVYAHSEGRATITATSEGVSATMIVNVGPFPGSDLMYHRPVGQDGAEIMFLALGRGSPVRLNAGNVSRHPSPSPDGTRFVFSVFQTDFGTGEPVHDLFVVNSNGLGMRRLTAMPGIETDPVWSPDGHRIAFTGWNADTETYDVFVVNADGTGLVSLTAVIGGGFDEMQPAWSADGGRLAFAARPAGGGGPARIWIMNADGTGHAALTTDAGYDAHPTWSPDGERIAFQRFLGGEGTDIAIAPVAGGPAVRLTRPRDQYQPVWSPDGKHIAFAERVPATLDRTEIFTMRPDGGTVRLRTTDPEWRGGSDPAWIARP